MEALFSSSGRRGCGQGGLSIPARTESGEASDSNWAMNRIGDAILLGLLHKLDRRGHSRPVAWISAGKRMTATFVFAEWR